jgi:predicted DNA-binding transcriptional regulator AlpA
MQTYFTGRQLEARYQRCGMTLHRWLKDDAMKFPQPIRIRGRKLWPVEAIEAWDRNRVNGATAAP